MEKITQEQRDYILEQFAKGVGGRIIPLHKDELEAFTKGLGAAQANIAKVLKDITDESLDELSILFGDELSFSLHENNTTIIMGYEDENETIESHRMFLNIEQAKAIQDILGRLIEKIEE